MELQSLSRLYQHYLGRSPFCQLAPHTYELLPEAGRGSIQRFTTYGGIEIVYSQLYYDQSYPTFFASKIPLIELQLAISGQRHVKLDHSDYTLPAGQGALIFLQNFKAHFYPPSGEPYISFALGIPVPLFHYAVSRLAAGSTAEFPKILNGTTFKALMFEPDERSTLMVRELIAGLHDERRSPLLMEASALEILDRCLVRLFDPKPMPAGLSRDDVRKLYLARSILESRMAEPPSLLALSRQVGLNDFKLKKGFKACFGTTVFGYLRQVRLDHAMRLLRNREHSVTETALSVGYSNISAFSQQFYRKYGVKPSEVKKLF